MGKRFWLENEWDSERVHVPVLTTDTLQDVMDRAKRMSVGYVVLGDPIVLTFGGIFKREPVAIIPWIEDEAEPFGGHYGEWEEVYR